MSTLAAGSGVGKEFAGRTLFKNISFGIDDRERVGLIGPNGAGKSTLMRLVAGLDSPDEGVITRKRGLRLGFLEQMPRFSAGQTILEAVLEKSTDPNEDLARAMTVMAQLELTRERGENDKVETLSGGWKKKVALARELLLEPELLLLDEPTNHLDVTSILWLERFLKSAPFSVLMVTHDRLFLQRVATRILDLDPRNPSYMLSAAGGYLQYVEAKEHELHALARSEKVLANTLRREREWLSRGSLARQTKQSARIQGAEALAETVDSLREKNRSRRMDLEFSEASRAPRKLIAATGLGKFFGEQILFTSVDLLITPKTRLALLGDNGCGKSTLVRTLLGEDSPSSGKVERADGLQVAYFEQGRDSLDHGASVLKNLCPEGDYVNFQGQFVHVRSYLDRFLFFGGKAELPVRKLSGGEQARLRLAQLMLQSCQVLVLDEPTNDLDAETLQVLAESLANFNGAVILVTHDRFFMDQVANQIVAFPPKELFRDSRDPERGKLQFFASYFQWEEWFESQKARSSVSSAVAADESRERKSAHKNPSPAPRPARLSYKEKYELENMESVIVRLEGEISILTAASQAPEVLADHKKLSAVLEQLAQKQAELEEKFERWGELEAKSKGSPETRNPN